MSTNCSRLRAAFEVRTLSRDSDSALAAIDIPTSCSLVELLLWPYPEADYYHHHYYYYCYYCCYFYADH